MTRHLVLPLAVLVALSTFAFAQPRERTGRAQGQRAPAAAPRTDDLKLTAQQEQQMQKLRLDLQKKETQIDSQIRVQQLDMKGQFLEDKPDRSAIDKIQKNISDLEYQAKQARTDHWFAVLSILTPEQQKIWKRHAGRWGEGNGPGMGMGNRPHQRMMMQQHRPGGAPIEKDEN
jgi:Spy/CpxP family protein refolding chaperone